MATLPRSWWSRAESTSPRGPGPRASGAKTPVKPRSCRRDRAALQQIEDVVLDAPLDVAARSEMLFAQVREADELGELRIVDAESVDPLGIVDRRFLDSTRNGLDED